MINYNDTILAQYGNSVTIKSLVESLNDNIDPRINIDEFYDYVFNVETAQGFGLDIWGKIVGVSRYLKIDAELNYFGFKQAFVWPRTVAGIMPFGFASFYNGVPATRTYQLADDAYRSLIMIKALANITNCTVPSLNKLMRTLFLSYGNVYVTDTGDMTIRFVFEFLPTNYQKAIMINSGVVPRPSGVDASLMIFNRGKTFGFKGAGGTPFGYGSFFTQPDDLLHMG